MNSAHPITPTPKALARDPSAKRNGLISPSTDHPMIANPTRIKIPAAIATSTFQAMRTAAQPAFIPPTSRSRCASATPTAKMAMISPLMLPPNPFGPFSHAPKKDQQAPLRFLHQLPHRNRTASRRLL